MEPTYILTAELDSDTFTWLDGLRRDHFPVERNLLPAHLTLFHRLSASQVSGLNKLATPTAAVPIECSRILLLGFGVAVQIRSPALEQIRDTVRGAMGGEFSQQDRQKWRAHVTIQNKVTATLAKRLHQELENGFVPRHGRVTGLLVWTYLNGPWRLEKRWPFE